MGRGRAGARSGGGGKRGRGEARNSSELREAPAPGAIPRFEIPNWQKEYGVVAGITGRGNEPGGGFDLGLWSKQPVGEVMSRWLAFRRSMSGFQSVALGNQVHGVELMTLGASHGWTQVEGIDGWITTTSGVLLTVTLADCVPVYLVVPGRGVALLHAGWRGTAGGILMRGVQRVVGEIGCSEREIIMHCGVGICGRCYEVGSEVMLGCGVPAEGSGPWHIDLRERLATQAADLGLSSVSRSPWCSAHDRPRFYSHRASGGTDGRMVAYLGMLPDPAR
jgi:polyphenol oxidase